MTWRSAGDRPAMTPSSPSIIGASRAKARSSEAGTGMAHIGQELGLGLGRLERGVAGGDQLCDVLADADHVPRIGAGAAHAAPGRVHDFPRTPSTAQIILSGFQTNAAFHREWRRIRPHG